METRIVEVPGKPDQEVAKWRAKAVITKYRVGEDRPYEMLIVQDNGLLNEGIQLAWDLILGTAGTSFTNANSRLGVGNGSAVFAATQTALQGGSSAFAPMAAGYPLRATQTVDWQGTFGTGSANFSWEEWSIDNGSTGTINLNRRVANMGTKTSTEIWVLTASISLS